MSVPVTSTAEVIADRYLTSPVSLRSRPFGPVDALDTHAGRAAQVRIVFLPGDWGHEELSETVARWCGIGTAGVIGVLDFGDHNGHPFLVLPPSLGMPLERWRAMRRPSPVDAARLALGFGRLVEAVAARGFVTDVAEATDFGVGPGPTPFLELPLLGRPDAPAMLRPEQDGQVLIARLYSATVYEQQLPAQITEWVERGVEPGVWIACGLPRRARGRGHRGTRKPRQGRAGRGQRGLRPPGDRFGSCAVVGSRPTDHGDPLVSVVAGGAGRAGVPAGGAQPVSRRSPALTTTPTPVHGRHHR